MKIRQNISTRIAECKASSAIYPFLLVLTKLFGSRYKEFFQLKSSYDRLEHVSFRRWDLAAGMSEENYQRDKA